jgi:two-component system sensor histidine kinase HydH
MHPLLQSSLMGAVFILAIAVSVILRSDKTRRTILFLILTSSIAVYYTSAFLYMWQLSEVFHRILLATSLVIPNTTLAFFRAFIGTGERKFSRLSIFLIAFSVLVAVVTVPPVLPSFVSGLIVSVFVGIMLYVSIYYLYRKSRAVESKVEATRITYLVIGGMIAVTFSFTDLLIIMDIPFLPIGPLMASIYLYLLSQAIISYRLMDLYEYFGRMAVLAALALTMAIIFSVLTLFEMASTSFFVNAMAAAFVMLILFDPLRDWVEQRIGEFFLKERSDFVNSIEDTKREVARAFEIDGIASTLLEGLKKSGRLTNACVYTVGERGEKFLLRGFLGQKTQAEINVGTARSLLDRMEEEGYIVAQAVAAEKKGLKERETPPVEREKKSSRESEAAVKEKDARAQRAAVLDSILTLMDDLKSDAVVPVKEQDMIYGFIGVRDERLRDAFSADDLQLLRSLGSHVAVAIENTRLYERIKERDRLAAIGEMSAGLAHEIRNPLGAIKGAVQFITEDGSDSAGRTIHLKEEKEFLDIIISEVDRLNKVVSSFLDYARPSHTRDEKAAADVNSVILQTQKIADSEIARANVEMEFSLGQDLAKVHMSEEKLGQVLWNLLINAIEATMDSGRMGQVRVSSRMVDAPRAWNPFYGPSGKGFIEVSVSDNGRGIPASILPKIFIPFYTTKQKGTGLGLAISHRIVREAGGVVEVDTRDGEGTTFKVLLPAM